MCLATTAYVYAGRVVHVTIFSIGGKFRPGPNFTKLYTLTITACSYTLLVICIVCMWSSAATLKRVRSQEFRTQTQKFYRNLGIFNLYTVTMFGWSTTVITQFENNYCIFAYGYLNSCAFLGVHIWYFVSQEVSRWRFELLFSIDQSVFPVTTEGALSGYTPISSFCLILSDKGFWQLQMSCACVWCWA